MRFSPGTDMLVCDHCGNTQRVAGDTPRNMLAEVPLGRALSADLPDAQMEITRVTTCPNCAAEVAFEAGRHATECPFCATPVVADTGTNRHIKPRGVVPFALDEASARDAMTRWLGSLWFAPSGLQRYARRNRAMQGLFVPYWTFDARSRSRYRGERGTVYFVTQTVVRDGKRQTVQVPRVRWRAASGQVARDFDDVLVPATTSLPDSFLAGLAPWDLTALAPYTPAYLAGFTAEAYGVPLDRGHAAARKVMQRTILRDVRFDIGGDRQRVHDVASDFSAETFKHILLPVWVAAYKYRGETFRFVVNGQTGQVQGARPFSRIKIALAVLAGAILAAILGYIYATTQ